MKERIIAIIQARMGSTRLPGKVLFNLEGKSVLEQIIARTKRSRLIQESIVATTILKEDLEIVNLCIKSGIRVYLGSAEDVLDRFFQAARLFAASHIVRITADCPFIDAEIIDKTIKLHLSSGADYTSNTLKETFPDGEDVEIFTYPVLKKAWEKARTASEHEHVTPYIRKHPRMFKLKNLLCAGNLSQKRWTLDEINDYQFVKLVYRKLYQKNRYFGMRQILELLQHYPEYEKINHGLKRNAGYLKSLREDRLLY